MRATSLGWVLGGVLAMAGCGGGSGTTAAAGGAGASVATPGAAAPAATTGSPAATGDPAPTAGPDATSAGSGAAGAASGAGNGAGTDPAATGSTGQGKRPFTLTWSVPDRNEDGTPLAAPPRFRIHFGRTSREYDATIELPQPGASRHVFTSLESGTWYLALTSIGSDGLESALSDEVVARVN